MARERGPTHKPRVRLTRERGLRAAIGIADEAGIEVLSMRKLGQALGVEAMSLYNHVANKDDILNGIVEIVESAIELPSPGADWKPALRKTAISAHDIFERHPWAAGLTLSSTGARPARWRYMNAILRCLREAGFSAAGSQSRTSPGTRTAQSKIATW
jgi:AcrR family transcriptional regulator